MLYFFWGVNFKDTEEKFIKSNTKHVPNDRQDKEKAGKGNQRMDLDVDLTYLSRIFGCF